MQLIGIALGGGVALLWGIADSIATLSTRRLTTFTTTIISHFSGLLTLIFTLAILFWHYPSHTFAISASDLLIGAGTGVLTVIGYLALYRSLELGPIAITSPLSSTSAVFTLLLSTLFLQEHITLFDGFAIGAIIIGVFLASVNIRNIHLLLKKKPEALLAGKGVRWACITPIAFGLVDISIGASSPLHGWFTPVFLTFVFSSFTLTILLLVRYPFSKEGRTLFMSVNTLFHKPAGILFAIGAGILECLAIVTFGIAAQTIKPGMIAAISSNYSLISVLFGVLVLGERLMANQKLGIGIVMCGLTVLTVIHI
ncbi:EamA family transporter [Ktedonobacter robiniae]|uniref:EamA domain-containing protein n=1 Tax=Ktedonobacter robiniae TaxID=2778365 RepID=A0ABQ3UMU2_9CHLR|nr:EamA family transporter [Ktedonobacter robiniae]GHO54066.1 hypothetical protein KSB_25410 [Ktedonobacter robiniae]